MIYRNLDIRIIRNNAKAGVTWEVVVASCNVVGAMWLGFFVLAGSCLLYLSLARGCHKRNLSLSKQNQQRMYLIKFVKRLRGKEIKDVGAQE